MSWTEERIEELTRLWEAGQSASQIGKSLGMSKNAVIGKAHRLKLPARPSPIRAASASTRPAMRNTPRPVQRQRPPGSGKARPHLESVTPVAPAPRQAPPRIAPRQVRRRADGRGCLWPIGDPGDADFHFCGGESVPGKPYCDTHCAKAYIVKNRQGSEAA